MQHLILLHSCLTLHRVWTIISVSRRHQWASQAFPVFCSYDQYYSNCPGLASTHICIYVVLLFRCAIAKKERWMYAISIASFHRDCQIAHHRGIYQFTLPPMIIENTCFHITSPTWCVINNYYLCQSREKWHLVV